MPNFSIPDIIKLGDISVPLSANYNYDGEVLGKRLATTSPLTIAIVTDALRWHYEAFPPTSITDAVGSITVTNVGNNGDKIEVFVNDVELGVISLGSYIKQPSDTTVNILAQSIFDALTNLNGYTTSLQDDTITITVRPGLGDSMNGNNRLQAVISVPTISATTLTPFPNTVVGNLSTPKTFRVSGTLLYGYPDDITITSPSSDFEVSNDNSTWGSSTIIPFTSDTISNIPIYVRFSPQSTGTKSGNISITGGGTLTPTLVAVSGISLAVPELIATPLNPFANTNVGSFSAPQIFDLSGVGLTNAPGVVTITAPSLNFQVSNNGTTWGATTTVPYSSDILSTVPVYVRYSPQAPGTPSGNISITGGSASTTVAVSGTTTSSLNATSLNPFPNTLSGTFSTSQTFTLTGVNLTGAPSNVVVTSPSTDFQVSSNGTTWVNSINVPYSTTTLSATTVYVRFSPQSTGTKSGNISITGGSASTTVPVSGVGVVEFSFDAISMTQIRFDSIETTNGFSILWKTGDEQTFTAGNKTNIIKSYTTPYTGKIKIRASALVDIKKIQFGFGSNAPQPPSSFTVKIYQSELGKLTGLTYFESHQSVKVYNITTLNLNRTLTRFVARNIDITGNIQDFPTALETIYLDASSTSSLTGSIDDMYDNCPNLASTWLNVPNTISGDISSIPTNTATFLVKTGNTIGGNLSGLSNNASLTLFLCSTDNVTGSLNDVNWTNLKLFECIGSGAKTGDISTITFNSEFYHINTNADISGSLSDLPNSMTYIRLAGAGSTLSGTTADIASMSNINTLSLEGGTEITGAVSTLPSSLRRLIVKGDTSALTGTLNDLPPNLIIIDIANNAHTVSGYTEGKYWGSPSGAVRIMSRLSVYGDMVTPLTLAETNNLFEDLDNSGTIWQNSDFGGGKVINYEGETPTGTGATAKTNLQNKGVIIQNFNP